MIVLSGRISSVYNELAPMQVIPIELVVMIAFALIVVKLFNSLRSMQIQMGAGVIVSRDESPLLFWLVIVLQCLAFPPRCQSWREARSNAITASGKGDRNVQAVATKKLIGEFRHFVSERTADEMKRLALPTRWKRQK